MKIKILFLVAIMLLCLAACGQSESERQIYVMDSVASVHIFPENEKVADELCSLLYELDSGLSPFAGELMEINSKGKGKASGHLRALLSRSLELSDKTGGAFSPALGPVIELWGIGEKNYVPAPGEISAAVKLSDVANIELSGEEIILKNGARLNFGAVAKGYASGIVREKLIEKGVESAVISLGGNVYVHGAKPGGEGWNVAIRDPAGDASEWLGSLELSNCFVISSGDYERFFISEGKKYHHIINPQTGCPAESDLAAVAVICHDGALGDAYSTALYVMGKEAALSFWREEGGFELVLVGKDGKVTVTEGISDMFTPNEEKGYSYETAYR